MVRIHTYEILSSSDTPQLLLDVRMPLYVLVVLSHVESYDHLDNRGFLATTQSVFFKEFCNFVFVNSVRWETSDSYCEAVRPHDFLFRFFCDQLLRIPGSF